MLFGFPRCQATAHLCKRVCAKTSSFRSQNGFHPANILIGAPKANTTQPGIIEGGSVFLCSWNLGQSYCRAIDFDKEGDRSYHVDGSDLKVEFKSHQWFGATVRSHGDTVLACAPRYYWRTENDIPLSDVTGTCYLAVDNFTTIVEYAPCRTERHGPAGQGYCQGGFSADFTQEGHVVVGGPGSFYWQGQLITATTQEIVRAYYSSYFLLSVAGQVQTRQVQSSYDDSYLGYSVAVGEFSGDKTEDFVTGVPKGVMLAVIVSLTTLIYFNVFQMGSYYGYAVAAADINNDGLVDLLVGSPLFMFLGSGGRLEEVGRVYVYLQQSPLHLLPSTSTPHLTGTHTYGRFGASISPLGDLDQDGYNDVAIGCPFGGKDEQGLVYIFNGDPDGLKNTPSQTLAGHWATNTIPMSFGYSLRGNKDIDGNGYPDLLVGAFGADKAALYRYFSRPIVNASAFLTVQPTMINPEEKNCIVVNENGTVPSSCVSLNFCLYADGKHLPDELVFVVELHLDSVKQKGAVRRALFFETQQHSLVQRLTITNGGRICDEQKIYLRGEKEFRDKLSPIVIGLGFSLDPMAPTDAHGLRPILNFQTLQLIVQKAQIQLDCGEDNICVPDLKLIVNGDREKVYLGDENFLTLVFNALNDGEGGAYEAELYVLLPPEAEYIGIARNNQSLTQLTCSYEAVNETHSVTCDLGNPMKSGTSLWAGLRFIVPNLKDTHETIQFELQIRSKNENNSNSEVVFYPLQVSVKADVILMGVSHPEMLLFPPGDWRRPQRLQEEQDIGPQIQHVYELVNNGPSALGRTTLVLQCPRQLEGHGLMYPLEVATHGPLNCSSKHTINPLHLKVTQTRRIPGQERIQRRDLHRDRLSQLSNLSCWTVECWRLQCDVGLLEKGKNAVMEVRSRLHAETFIEREFKQYVLECMVEFKVENIPYAILPEKYPSGAVKVETPLVWSNTESPYAVPLWIIILAILVGLLLLALLIYVLYKLGFFKRSDPYGTAMEKAQLKPQASSEA
uniref:Integrin alpha-2 domain-containing protein n=1 Tax=Denticeps clupeoides TaxID=299321 RepID=A0AAY4ECZ1_9TELE